jgi:hypothetical protein
MNTNQTFFHKYELPLFFLLTYLLSWWTVPFMNGGLFPYGPALAAAIVVALIAGAQGLRDFWQRLTSLRAGWWYLIGPTIIAAYLLVAFGVNLLFGATMVNPFPFPSIGTLAILLVAGGLWEEPGWTGYALAKLQERFASQTYGTLAATLVVGFFRGLWHLPLVVNDTITWYDALFFSLALQIIISWVYNKSKSNIMAAMVTHYSSNVFTGYTMLLVFTGIEKTNYYTLFVFFACVAASVIIWKSRFQLGLEKSFDQTI